MSNYTQKNKECIERWITQYGLAWARPITHEEYVAAQQGEYAMKLTPVRTIPKAWIGDVRGKSVLGLAAGGGQQMPLLTACGARCTVLDISEVQLAAERAVAQREGYDITVIAGDMTAPLPFSDGTFDMIVHPVSNHYVQKVEPIFRECFRVLKPGGVLLCGLDTGIYWAFDLENEGSLKNILPFDPLTNAQQRAYCEEQDMGLQFSHTLEEQLGGQLRAGFVLIDLYEDTNGAGAFHEHNVPTFIATRAQKPL
ncbi:MAG: class I SAM-dependent methyltransferase [Ruminococcaceae bacterium]|nr:class I SAM-dependent methyltransferase [Oscillospiraceae bacterium]